MSHDNLPSGLKAIPGDIPDDTTLLDLQNNKITEIKENDFKNLKGLHVRDILLPSAEIHVCPSRPNSLIHLLHLAAYNTLLLPPLLFRTSES